MVDFQSMRREYRHTDQSASGLPIGGVSTLSVMRSDFGSRLVQARKHAKMTQHQGAKDIMSQSTLAELEKVGQGSAHTEALAKRYGVRVEWLARGEEPMTHVNVEPAPERKGGDVPLISWVQAGDWNGAADPLQPGDAEAWLTCPRAHSSRTYALRVRGDSMTAPHGNLRTYPEGCIIFVDPERRMPVNGERIVAKLSGTDEVTFKVYKNEDGRQWLQPLNHTHPPIRDEFRVLGTVIGKWEDE